MGAKARRRTGRLVRLRATYEGNRQPRAFVASLRLIGRPLAAAGGRPDLSANAVTIVMVTVVTVTVVIEVGFTIVVIVVVVEGVFVIAGSAVYDTRVRCPSQSRSRRAAARISSALNETRQSRCVRRAAIIATARRTT